MTAGRRDGQCAAGAWNDAVSRVALQPQGRDRDVDADADPFTVRQARSAVVLPSTPAPPTVITAVLAPMSGRTYPLRPR